MTLTKLATFAAGCFWGVEEAFERSGKVLSTLVGYTGGRQRQQGEPPPSYEQVCTGRTGHAEAVQVAYDPTVTSYDELLDLFWSVHDPTTLNRQGPDQGTQYRSAIFWHDEDQKRAAEKSRQQETARRSRPVVTQVEQAGPFYAAEEYHQQYLRKTGRSCHVNL